MRWTGALLVVIAVLAVGPGHCAITRCERLTDLAKVMDGAFRPGSDDIALVRYDTKRFNRAGNSFGYEVVVDLLHDGKRRELLRVPPYVRRQAHTAGLAVRWLPGGRHLYAATDAFWLDRSGWLVSADGGVCTRVGRFERWFVTNRRIALTGREARALNTMVHDAATHVECLPRWLWDGLAPQAGLPHWHGIGYTPPARPAAAVQFAELRSPRRPGPGESTGAAVSFLDGALVAPRLWFTCSDPASPAPDGRHVLYQGTADGREELEGGDGNFLWVKRSDGAARRQLTWRPTYWFAFLTDDWAVYAVGGHTGARQLAIVNTQTAGGQWLTKGDFRHFARDYRDGKFLISEYLGGGRAPGYCPASCALYVLRPLRVKL